MADARNNIPSLRGLPFIGNLLDVQNEVPIHGLERLIDLCGPIARFSLFGRETIVVGSVALMEELSDEKRFWKTPPRSLVSKSETGTRGLFSAESEDTLDWQQAHRTLMPAFGPVPIEGMFEEMYDIACQLALKFARLGPSYRIPATSDFTRLTLDTIALCAMGFRFNSFYQDEMHPFVNAMNNMLATKSDGRRIGSMFQRMLPWDRTLEKAEEDSNYMRDVGEELVRERRENPTEKHDLLNTMILGKDPKTGEKMSDQLISANMVSFLVAGHETTSGLLSFAFIHLLQNPEAYLRVQEEVDRVVGSDRLTAEHLRRMEYADAVLRETLRLNPTAPAFVRSIRSNNSNDVEPLAGGQYAIHRDDEVMCLLGKIQRDPAVFGEDADAFKPERMIEERFRQLPHSAWKPFGTGIRGCIGRAFAWQEAKICLAVLFRYFDFRLDDPSYHIKVKQTLTVKPQDFYMRASLRNGMTSTTLQSSLFSAGAANVHTGKAEHSQASEGSNSREGKASRISILYGGNAGTCQALAQRLAADAGSHGFNATVLPMDEAVNSLPTDHPVAIITASYDGEPPDNASQFVAWLRAKTIKIDLSKVRFAVFGCGHSDWVDSFQRIPTLVDDLLAKHGGTRIVARGAVDAAKGSIQDVFEGWTTSNLWPALLNSAGSRTSGKASAGLTIDLRTHDRGELLQQPGFHSTTVVAARTLTAAGEPEKRHLEIRLPDNLTYTPGDYLTVLPKQPAEIAQQVCKRFDIPEGATMTVQPGAATFLPTDDPLAVMDVLQGYVELGAPASKSEIQACIDACSDADDRTKLKALLSDTLKNRHPFSLLDILLRFSSIELSFSAFLALLPPLRPRFYSISSSPAIVGPQCCTLTYGVIDSSSPDGRHHLGVAGTYMARLQPGDALSIAVRATNRHFRLPASPETTPLIMLCAGTGLAPFRAFVQERGAQLRAGRKLAPALLFIGCRAPDRDRLYGAELDELQAQGAVAVRYAFSRAPEAAEGCRYVQDRLWRERAEVGALWRAGAKVYVCCAPDAADEIERVTLRMLQDSETGAHEGVAGMEEAEARAWLRERRNKRIVVDTFA